MGEQGRKYAQMGGHPPQPSPDQERRSTPLPRLITTEGSPPQPSSEAVRCLWRWQSAPPTVSAQLTYGVRQAVEVDNTKRGNEVQT